MKIYQLIAYQFDVECGNSENVLITIKNKQQLDSIARKLNKKYGSKPNATDYTTKFSVEEIDTNEIPDTLTHEDKENLWH